MYQWLVQQGIWASLTVFALAALAVLYAGNKLEKYAHAISSRTTLGQTFGGVVLLATVTALPEVATVIPAVLRGNSELAVFNLLGSSIFNLMIIGVVDGIVVKKALTSFAPSYSLLIQGVGLIFMLGYVVVAISLEMHWAGTGWSEAMPLGTAALYLVVQFIVLKSVNTPRWEPISDSQPTNDKTVSIEGNGESDKEHSQSPYLPFALAALLILVAGYSIIIATESISEKTGLEKTFLGLTVVSISTSLPEVTTTLLAAKRDRLVMAWSNIFGSNLFNTALLALVALLSTEKIFGDNPIPSIFVVGVSILLTAIYILGMLERRDRTILRVGLDSLAVLAIGLSAMAFMYFLTS